MYIFDFFKSEKYFNKHLPKISQHANIIIIKDKPIRFAIAYHVQSTKRSAHISKRIHVNIFQRIKRQRQLFQT